MQVAKPIPHAAPLDDAPTRYRALKRWQAALILLALAMVIAAGLFSAPSGPPRESTGTGKGDAAMCARIVQRLRNGEGYYDVVGAELVAGHYLVNPCLGAPAPEQVLSAPSGQFRGLVGFGRTEKRGWNAVFLAVYDHRLDLLEYGNVQATYSAGCRAFNVQFRRWNFGTRGQKQWKFSVVLANIGSVGSLRRLDRLF